tara:strand:- start:1709 stop:1939 length:231 start_codon:yes stop_codon:yes gene_type:complete
MSISGLKALESELDSARSMDDRFDEKCAYHDKLMNLYYRPYLSPMQLDQSEEGRKINKKICAQIAADMKAKFGDDE